MKILVLNAGSSSLKYQLFEFPSKEVLVSGLVERIGEELGKVKHDLHDGRIVTQELQVQDHQVALNKVADLLLNDELAVVESADEIQAVGHRVVHGGEEFSAPSLIEGEELLNTLKDLSYLAPLHNPANIVGIEVAMKVFPKAKQVAVFDTAFHQTIPDFAYRYALPKNLYTEHGIRQYGFHGTSHQYVSRTGAEFLNIDPQQFNAISIHLGNGCSITAIKNGKSIDTSMGLTPIGGLVMGSRPGDFDPSILLYLGKTLDMSWNEIDTLLNKKSGLIALTGENDLREILQRYEAKDPEAQLAIDMYVYRIRKYIGAYAAAIGRLDAILFTAGVGENSAIIREKVCENMDILGIRIDSSLNSSASKETRAVQHVESKVKVLVVPTNEELEIANEANKLIT